MFFMCIYASHRIIVSGVIIILWLILQNLCHSLIINWTLSNLNEDNIIIIKYIDIFIVKLYIFKINLSYITTSIIILLIYKCLHVYKNFNTYQCPVVPAKIFHRPYTRQRHVQTLVHWTEWHIVNKLHYLNRLLWFQLLYHSFDEPLYAHARSKWICMVLCIYV